MGVIRRFFILIILILVYLTTAVTAKEGFSHFVDQHFKRIKSFQSDFHQVYYDALRESRTESFGTVRYSQPGRMHWSYLRPDRLEVYIGKEKIWVVDPLLENVTIQRLDKVTRMNALSFLLNKNKLRNHFVEIKTTNDLLDRSQGVQHLSLAPKEKSRNLSELQIGYDSKSFAIKQFVIIDAQNNYRKITFSKILKNIKIDLKSFEFEVPDEMEIIDGIGN